MAEAIWKFYADCGRMGSLDGVFCAEEEDVKNAVGETAYFGEVLGKHSEVFFKLKAEHMVKLTDDTSFIAKAKEYGLLGTGFNPLDYLNDDE